MAAHTLQLVYRKRPSGLRVLAGLKVDGVLIPDLTELRVDYHYRWGVYDHVSISMELDHAVWGEDVVLDDEEIVDADPMMLPAPAPAEKEPPSP